MDGEGKTEGTLLLSSLPSLARAAVAELTAASSSSSSSSGSSSTSSTSSTVPFFNFIIGRQLDKKRKLLAGAGGTGRQLGRFSGPGRGGRRTASRVLGPGSWVSTVPNSAEQRLIFAVPEGQQGGEVGRVGVM